MGRCLTALTDKSCQRSVCNIEQELKCFDAGSGGMLPSRNVPHFPPAVYIDSRLHCGLMSRISLLLLSSQLSPSFLTFFIFE